MMEDNGAHFFEGTEKLLEVWFSRQDETKGTGDLRTIPRCVSFEGVRCGVVSQQLYIWTLFKHRPRVWLYFLCRCGACQRCNALKLRLKVTFPTTVISELVPTETHLVSSKPAHTVPWKMATSPSDRSSLRLSHSFFNQEIYIRLHHRWVI